MSSESLHEPRAELDDATLDRHRAIASLMEELEAVDWYDQRIQATKDPSLKAVLAHNRDEEKEHAAMMIEWLRRHDPAFDGHLREFLFTDGDIVAQEHGDEHGDDGADGADGAFDGRIAKGAGLLGTDTEASS